jgi:alpha-ketoglutarate-dependent taurine dioxygenase
MLLIDPDDYKYWRDEKLANAVSRIEECLVEIANPYVLTDAEKGKIQQLCQYNNFALFETRAQDNYAEAIMQFNRQFGLTDQDQHLYADGDGLARISQSDQQKQAEFIPYTDKAIGWHTDGYYNSVEQRIRAFSLFCVTPASAGGENQWIDSQMVYLLLRENNIDVATALTHPKAMSIPAHIVDGVSRRKTSIGPIFFTDQRTKQLMMRYTQRKRNIEFYDSTEIKQAIALLDDLLNAHTAHHFQHLMRANQGIICNNVVHNRSKFVDDKSTPRLLLRGRYFNSVS